MRAQGTRMECPHGHARVEHWHVTPSGQGYCRACRAAKRVATRTRSRDRAPVPAPWDAAVGAWGESLRLAGYPATTIRTRLQMLWQLAQESPTGPWEHTTDTLAEWIGSHGWAVESRYSARSSVRMFYAWAYRAGKIPADPAMDLPRVRRGMGTPRPAPDAAYAAALASAGPRERLMMRLAAEAGLRRGEISRVHTDDLVQDFDGWSILVHGKGGRDRLIPVPQSLAVGLVEHAGRGGGYVFPGAHDGHLSPQRVGDLVSELLPDGWTAHTLRHRFASRAFRVDRDLITVQNLLGHSSVATTQRYVAVSQRDMRRTVDTLAAS